MVISLRVPVIVLMMRKKEAVDSGILVMAEHMSSLSFTYLEEEVILDWDHLLDSKEGDGCQLTLMISEHPVKQH